MTMDEAITHLKVPIENEEPTTCLGPDGSVTHVDHVFQALKGRWKLQILFRLCAQPSMRSSQFLRDMPGITQKVLTQQLRDLENDGLVERQNFGEQPPRVEYRLTASGHELMPALLAIREYSRKYLDPK